MTTLPNFLYIGTSKAGSTWLFNALSVHPEVHLAPNKGLYYFDRHLHNGEDWYLAQFDAAPGHRAVGEISHSYLSSPEAASRIAALNPRMRLLVCLREPADRAFSDYLDLVKNGQFTGGFEAALEQYPRLFDRGRYATHLGRYLESFPMEQLHVGLFDDLRQNPQAYADDVYRFLGIEQLELAPAQLKSRMPAGTPRSTAAAEAAKSASRLAKRIGVRRLRSRVKRSTLVRQMLYRPYADDRPTMDPAVASALRDRFADEVLALDTMLGQPVSRRWGYTLV